MKFEVTEKEKQDIYNLYFKKNYTLKQIANKYDVAVNTIKRFLILNYPTEYQIASKRNYKNLNINHSFFNEIDSEEKAYILGFLMADGNLYRVGNVYKIRICLALQDYELLRKIKNVLKLESNINIYHRKGRENSQSECNLVWTSKEQFLDLCKYGVTPNKTLHEQFPKELIPNSMLRHFIRGYFDGDGSISKRKEISFIGSYEFIYDLKEHLCNTLGVYPSKIIARTKKSTVYQISWASAKDIEKIFNYFYVDSTIFLSRKYYKFL